MKVTVSAGQEEMQAIGTSHVQVVNTIWAHQEKIEDGQEQMRATIWAEKKMMLLTLSAIWPAQTIFKGTIIKQASVD